MDGAFMKKWMKWSLICLILAAAVWSASVIRDRYTLNESVIRFHVVANSDTSRDQQLKLLVRDAVTQELQPAMQGLTDVHHAKDYLSSQLEHIRALAEETLRQAGCEDAVTVTLGVEPFGTRHYDTFSLPAGSYESLRIVIGEGDGQNWWCVVFPTLCYSAAGDSWEDQAAGAGFPDTLTEAMEGEKGYSIRFYLLDLLGRAENFLRFG